MLRQQMLVKLIPIPMLLAFLLLMNNMGGYVPALKHHDTKEMQRVTSIPHPPKENLSSSDSSSILYNVICIGDSITSYGNGTIEGTYPGMLEQLLRRPHPSPCCRDNGVVTASGIKVSNFGKEGRTAGNRDTDSYMATTHYREALEAMEHIWVGDSDITKNGVGDNSDNLQVIGSGQNTLSEMTSSPSSKVGVLVLMLGTNDARQDKWVSTVQYVEDMVEIATSLINRALSPQGNTSCPEEGKLRLVVALMTPPPLFMRPLLQETGTKKGKYQFASNPLDRVRGQNIANKIRDAVAEVAKRLTDKFGILSTPSPQRNIATDKKCLSSMDVRVSVSVIDLFALFLNAMIETQLTIIGCHPHVARTSDNSYLLDAASVHQWLGDGIHATSRGNDLISNAVYESIVYSSTTLKRVSCLKTRCVRNAVQFKMMENNEWIACPSEGDEVSITGYDGTVTCPDPNSVCDGVEMYPTTCSATVMSSTIPKDDKTASEDPKPTAVPPMPIVPSDTTAKSPTAISSTIPAVLISSVVFMYLSRLGQ